MTMPRLWPTTGSLPEQVPKEPGSLQQARPLNFYSVFCSFSKPRPSRSTKALLDMLGWYITATCQCLLPYSTTVPDLQRPLTWPDSGRAWRGRSVNSTSTFNWKERASGAAGGGGGCIGLLQNKPPPFQEESMTRNTGRNGHRFSEEPRTRALVNMHIEGETEKPMPSRKQPFPKHERCILGNPINYTSRSPVWAVSCKAWAHSRKVFLDSASRPSLARSCNTSCMDEKELNDL